MLMPLSEKENEGLILDILNLGESTIEKIDKS